jgi:hypothetical protein
MSGQRLEIRGEYPPDWDEIGDRVRAEAGNRCIRCGHPQGDKLYTRAPCDDSCTHARDGKMRVLTVHHLDGDKANVRWWNLLSLCQACHLSIQGRVIPERVWLFDHSPWFVPYVCGFYASYYGGQEITRAEAESDPTRWLALNPAAAV